MFCFATIKYNVYKCIIFCQFLPAQIERVGDRPLRDVLDSYGGWPVASKTWDPEKFDLELILGKMREKFASVPSLMEAWVAPDDKNSTINIIQVKRYKK